jgi:hypothetical protein
MAYQVDKFNGTFLTSVEDGTIDTTTDIRFVGKNYAGYGEVQNENFLHLLENFANTSAPPKAVTGQVWYDSANKKLKFYDGSQFKSASGAEVATSAPSGLGTGEFWWDSSAKQLYAYDGTEYVLVGPEASPDLGTSTIVSEVVKDTLDVNQTILKVIAAGTTIAVASSTEFTLKAGEALIGQGFELIKKGVTLVNTNSNGVTSTDHYFWGTSSNALRLNGKLASEYLTTGDLAFTSEVSFNNPGFTVGTASNPGKILRIWYNPEENEQVGAIIENQLSGRNITVRVREAFAGAERDVFRVTENGVQPGTTATYDLGTTSLRWDNVYATLFTGNLTGNVTGNTTGVHTGNVIAPDTQVLVNATSKEIGYTGGTLRGTLFGDVQGTLTGTADNANLLTSIAPSIALPASADKTSIPVRDATGNITAAQFVGTADKADRIKIDNSATDTDPNYRTAKSTATANSIAARDSAGDLYAALFQGTATAARYADLAEKYLADEEYETGTVVSVGGAKEITASKTGDRPIGVISENPAFMMNKDLEGGVYVALKGRVPVKVFGPVHKGDRLVAHGIGFASVDKDSCMPFAIALESSDSIEVKLIEAVVL